MTKGVEEHPTAALAPKRVARMGDRVFATFLDLFVLLPLLWLVISIIAVENRVYKDGNATLVGGPALLGILFITVTWIAFYVIAEYFFAGSPGKHIMGIKVVSQQEDRMTLQQSVVRNLLRPIDAIGFYALGFVVVLCSTRRQRLGDRAAGTLVLEQSESRRIVALTVLIALIIAAYGGALIFMHFAR